MKFAMILVTHQQYRSLTWFSGTDVLWERSFWRVSRETRKTLRKLYVSTKFQTGGLGAISVFYAVIISYSSSKKPYEITWKQLFLKGCCGESSECLCQWAWLSLSGEFRWMIMSTIKIATFWFQKLSTDFIFPFQKVTLISLTLMQIFLILI